MKDIKKFRMLLLENRYFTKTAVVDSSVTKSETTMLGDAGIIVNFADENAFYLIEQPHKMVH